MLEQAGTDTDIEVVCRWGSRLVACALPALADRFAAAGHNQDGLLHDRGQPIGGSLPEFANALAGEQQGGG